MRNSYKDLAYFQNQSNSFDEDRDLVSVYLAKPDLSEQGRQAMLHDKFDVELKEFQRLYNLGEPIDAVVGCLNQAWPLFIDAHEYSLNRNVDLMDKLQLVPAVQIKIFSLLVLSDPPKEIAHRILNFTNTDLNYGYDQKEGCYVDIAFDGFFRHFADYFDFRSEKTTAKILDEELYGMLNGCFNSPQDKQRILFDYVNQWRALGQKTQIYSKNEHKMSTNENFLGYWCFHAAAVAKILNIDDSPLKDHPDYPYDLVHR